VAAVSASPIATTAARAEGFFGSFVDPEDHAFDCSEWLLDRKGFLPVPIVITEPAIGYGGGVALAFFRQSMREVAGRHRPPDIFAAAFAATENGTKLLGGGGLLTFRQDPWRYRGALGRTDIFLHFYADGDAGGGNAYAYNVDGWVSSQQGLRRLGNTNHFIAARWVYFDLDSRFDSSAPPGFPSAERSDRNSGAGVSWEYDSRDNIFTASRGTLTAVSSLFYGSALGGDHTFQSYRANSFVYVPLRNWAVLGLRLDARMAHGDVPFYQLPFIDLRGIPIVRYQNENVGVAEMELRWSVTRRWAVMGYAGAGRAWGRGDDFEAADTHVAGGTGFRYLLARRLDLYSGLDLAWGPEEHAFYIQFGSAWR